ncbi:MAG: SGNH/GDSL hydrolase family protein [Planctomycetota bacterium]
MGKNESNSETQSPDQDAQSQPTPSPRRRRLKILLSLLAVVALASIGYIYFFLQRPTGSGPAGPKVDDAPFAATWTDREIVLLGIGDSVTRGLGAKSPQHSYFERLIKNPSDEYPDMQGNCLSRVLPGIHSKNIAVSGSTSIHHETHIAELLEPFPDNVFGLVVMTTGGNDIIHNYGMTPPSEGAMYGATLTQAQPWIENFETRLNGMLDSIETLFPGGCEIYLADIYDPTDGVGDAPSIFLPHWKDGLAVHAAYNEILRRSAEARPNIFSVPLHHHFLGHGAHCRQFWREHYQSQDPTYWFYTNVEDPNDRGYDAIRRIFLNTIVESTRLRS